VISFVLDAWLGIESRLTREQINLFFLINIAGVGGLIFLLFNYFVRRKQFFQQRTDELLLNILPKEVATELKEKGTTTAKVYEEVTVLFTDFENFTLISESMNAQDLVNEIHYCYSAFDTIISRHGLEKIKTIGDSYMCAAGLPVKSASHAYDAAAAALEMCAFIEKEKQIRSQRGLPFFDIRVGLHSGPVVAGIVGLKKFQYDIWGDTVNIAKRLESGGQAGKVNISGSTYHFINDRYDCHYRGRFEAKHKGQIDMYFVEGAKNETI
jgi:class 3 adenylate cyclase